MPGESYHRHEAAKQPKRGAEIEEGNEKRGLQQRRDRCQFAAVLAQVSSHALSGRRGDKAKPKDGATREAFAGGDESHYRPGAASVIGDESEALPAQDQGDAKRRDAIAAHAAVLDDFEHFFARPSGANSIGNVGETIFMQHSGEQELDGESDRGFDA